MIFELPRKHDKDDSEEMSSENYGGEEGTCANCGMDSTQWQGDGFEKDGEIYCCEGCADDTGCTCVEEMMLGEEGGRGFERDVNQGRLREDEDMTEDIGRESHGRKHQSKQHQQKPEPKKKRKKHGPDKEEKRKAA